MENRELIQESTEDDLVYAPLPEVCERDIVGSLADAKIGITDASLLMMMWGIAFLSSIFSLGRLPAIPFLLLNTFLVLRKPINGVLVLILITFTPTATLYIPREFVTSSAIAMFGYFLHGLYIRYPLFLWNRIIGAVCAFLTLCAVVTGALSSNEEGMYYMMEYIEGFVYVCMLLALVNTYEDFGVALKWLAIVAGLAFIANLAQYLFTPNTALLHFVEAVQGKAALVGKTTLDQEGLNINRILWPGAEPNYFAGQLIFPLSLAMVYASFSGHAIRRVFWIGIASLIALGVLGTYSRGGVISACFLFFMFFISRGRKGMFASIFFLLFLGVLASFVPAIQERILSIPRSIMEEGATGRIPRFIATIRYWFSSPIWGHGLGSVNQHVGGPTHNVFLQVLAETGLIGEFIYLSIIYIAFSFLRKVRMFYSEPDHPNAILAKGILLGLLSTCLCYNGITVQDPKFLWLICSLCVSFYVVLKRQYYAEQMNVYVDEIS